MGMWGHGIMDGDPAMDVVEQIARYCDMEERRHGGAEDWTGWISTEALLPQLNRIERDLIINNEYQEEILPAVHLLLEAGFMISPDLDRYIDPAIQWEMDNLDAWTDPPVRRAVLRDLKRRIRESRK